MHTIHRVHKHAFTLIELLVVIAIIAILAAILFPVFGRARDKARQASCGSNLKQMGLAFLQYQQDYDGKFPTPGGRSMNGDPGAPAVCRSPLNGWIQSAGAGLGRDIGGLWPYIKSRGNGGSNVWSCPNAIAGQNNQFSPGQNFSMNDYVRRGHPGQAVTGAANPCGPMRPEYFDGLHESAAPSPAELILIYEAVQTNNGSVARNGSPYFCNATGAPTNCLNSQAAGIPANVPHIWHGGNSNFLFVDGHVKANNPRITWGRQFATQVCQFNPLLCASAPYGLNGTGGGGTTDLWNPQVGGSVYP